MRNVYFKLSEIRYENGINCAIKHFDSLDQCSIYLPNIDHEYGKTITYFIKVPILNIRTNDEILLQSMQNVFGDDALVSSFTEDEWKAIPYQWKYDFEQKNFWRLANRNFAS